MPDPSARRQTFGLLQRLTALTVAALGFCALWIAGELSGVMVVAAAAATSLSAWDARPRASARVWLVIQLLFLAWLGQGWLLGGRHVLSSFAWLLVFVQLHRLLTRSSTRDDLYSYFIAFGQLLLCSVLTVSAAYFIVFVAFFVTLTWALLLTRLARSVEEDWRQAHGTRPVASEAFASLGPLMRWPFALAVTSLTVTMLAGTLLLFFVLPRLQASFLSASLLPPIPVSGFSEQVRLGEIGIVQLSNEPVMRIRLTDSTGQQATASAAYWHGLAMDRFDGRVWSLSDTRRTQLGWVGGARTRGPPNDRSWSLRQEITLEPLDSNVLFHISQAAGIYGDFRSLEAAETEGYFLPGPRRRQTYVAYSEPVVSDLEELRAAAPRQGPDTVLTPATQLPDGLSPQIADLAREWTRGAATAADAALLIQQHLREDFTYSLAQPSSAAADPLLAFLTEDREGHCEYFATAMVVMLRTQGIPARIVNGFQGGEWNPVGEYWLVRQRDAHSWVEVWFGESDWVIFDPTPLGAGGVRGRARIRLLARLGAWADFGRVRWTEVMLDYGLDNQAEGLRRALAWMSGDSGYSLVRLMLDGSGSSGRDRTSRGAGLPWGGLATLLALGLLAVLVVRLRGRNSRRSRHLPQRLRRLAGLVTRLELRWRRASARAPDPPRTDATVLGWATWVAERAPRLEAAPAVIERYYSARFGSGAPERGLERELRRLLRASRGLRRQLTSTGQKRSVV